MIRFVSCLAICIGLTGLPVVAHGDETDQWQVIEVIDGDTVRVMIPALPRALRIDSIRVLGVDTPETWKPNCPAEAEAGARATAWLRDAVDKSERIRFKNIKGRDVYARILAEVWIDGKNIADQLIALGLGTKRRSNWCD